MNRAINKAAIEKQINDRIGDQRKWGSPVNLEIAREIQAIMDEIQSGEFDLFPTDVDAKEIEEALNSEQANYGCGCNFTKAPLWLRQLLTKLAEKEAEVEELRQFYKDAMQEQAREYIESITENQTKLNQTVEALERIKNYYGEEGYYGYSVANQTLQSIKNI